MLGSYRVLVVFLKEIITVDVKYNHQDGYEQNQVAEVIC